MPIYVEIAGSCCSIFIFLRKTVAKSTPASAGDIRDVVQLGSGRLLEKSRQITPVFLLRYPWMDEPGRIYSPEGS